MSQEEGEEEEDADRALRLPSSQIATAKADTYQHRRVLEGCKEVGDKDNECVISAELRELETGLKRSGFDRGIAPGYDPA